MALWCKICRKRATELPEYVEEAKNLGCTPDEFVEQHNVTYNKYTGLFYCTRCHLMVGRPKERA
jgi:hypothetical protein